MGNCKLYCACADCGRSGAQPAFQAADRSVPACLRLCVQRRQSYGRILPRADPDDGRECRLFPALWSGSAVRSHSYARGGFPPLLRLSPVGDVASLSRMARRLTSVLQEYFDQGIRELIASTQHRYDRQLNRILTGGNVGMLRSPPRLGAVLAEPEGTPRATEPAAVEEPEPTASPQPP